MDKKKQKNDIFLQWLLALVLALVFLSFSVTVVVRWSGLYRFEVRSEGLSQELGVSEEFILDQYKTLISYNLIGGPDQLVFPGLPSSESALIHFAEVKRIFLFFQYAWWIGLILVIVGGVLLRKTELLFLKLAGILSLVLPAAMGLGAVLFWQQFFVLFHQLLFRNDFWLFDETTDPIIRLLPDSYFLHCAIAIVGMTILWGILSCMGYAWTQKRRRKQYGD
jgi:integral membrane protein (TIGR01906 family)